MGVKFKDIVTPTEINFTNLKGKVIAIDAANTIYQFLSGIRQRDGNPLMDASGRVTSHFSGLLYRTTSLIEKGIKPIYIFDGKSPELKGETVNKRIQARQESEKKWKEALEKGDLEEARKYAVRSSRMSPEIVDTSKKLLELMGIPYIQALGEGEAQASFMVHKGDAWAVASQDYDCLLFGAPRIVRNLTLSSKQSNLELLELDKVLSELDITREQLIDLALLVGTDFNPGVHGVGAKTGLKLIKKEKNLYNALKKKDVSLEEFGPDPQVVRDIFLNHNIITDYKIKWKKPDKSGLLDFLSGEYGFSEERVLSASNKIKVETGTQKTLEDWF
jgi:flap endonuclease-1